MCNSQRILIIAIYLGPLPPYFPLWLNSCRFNSSIDWLFITDNDISSYQWPINVHPVRLSITDLSDRFSQAAGFQVSLLHPYKLCDFRPLYWALLDLVPGHWDFWGHCDIDMLFGDIQRFLPPDLLSSHEKLFGLGHLTLYKNDQTTNTFYTRPHPSIDYRQILTNPAHFGFDEHIGINLLWRWHAGRFHEDESVVADIDPHISRLTRTIERNSAKNYRHQIFCFDNGRVLRLYWSRGKINTDEYMYIHFQKRSMSELPLPRRLDQVFITPRGFVDMTNPVRLNKASIAQLNPHTISPPLPEIRYRVLRRLRQIRLSLQSKISA